VKIEELASYTNLELAWRRITTGANAPYKRYFRQMYYSYEIALGKNLTELQARVKGGSFAPGEVRRIYLPKQSGLHRPITLLSLEDQILLQAIANLVAKKIQPRRKPMQMRYVFSNILQDPNSIFFFYDWKQTYHRFQRQIEQHYQSGLKWVGDFDLAAFYDTISHELLLKTAYPKLAITDDVNRILGWLKIWASVRPAAAHGHGIPQGPIASDFLAECFLLPVDKNLAIDTSFVRYVDDLRVLGRSEEEVRRGVIKLEMLCRERGLIPQIGKYAIRQATSLRDALGMLPSIAAPHDTGLAPRMGRSEAIRLFRKALAGRKQHIADKTRARYVLYRADRSPQLLTYVLRLLPRHPEHVDAFVHYLSQYSGTKRIREAVLGLLASSPYEYVKGEMWHLLARMLRIPLLLDKATRQKLVTEAVDATKSRKVGVAIKWGALDFLCVADQLGFGRYGEFLRYLDSAILQALLVPVIPVDRFEKPESDGVIARLLKRTAPEPGLMLAEPLAHYGLAPKNFGVTDESVASQAANVLMAVGIIKGVHKHVDPLGEILVRRYGIPNWGGWRNLLGGQYVHAVGLLAQADPVFLSGPSRWLTLQNSFNQALFLAIQGHLRAAGLPGEVATIGRNGQLVDFGTTVQSGNQFSKAYPVIADVFRDMNTRRNKLPSTHPYDKKTTSQNVYLKPQERNKYLARLGHAYKEAIRICT